MSKLDLEAMRERYTYYASDERRNQIVDYIQDLQEDNYNKKIDLIRVNKKNIYLENEIERLNKIRQQVIDELFDLKNMIYKPETREINFDVQNKISSIIKILGSDKE